MFIPKPGRPRNKIESDCPISVLKVYYKAIAKLFANLADVCMSISRIHSLDSSQLALLLKPQHTCKQYSTGPEEQENLYKQFFLEARVAFDLKRTEATTAMMKHLGTPATEEAQRTYYQGSLLRRDGWLLLNRN